MNQFLLRDNVSVVPRVDSWQDAVRKGGQGLVDGGFVTPDYLEAIIRNVEEHGPYIVLTPLVALPHARPEAGALKTQFAVMLVEEPVFFNEEKKDVRLFITMAAPDATSHMEALVTIAQLLQDETQLEELIRTADADELFAYFSKVNQ